MLQGWAPEELIESWTLATDAASDRDDWQLVGNKSGPTRLGFALLLKFYELEARFPRHAGEVPRAAVDYLAGQVGVDPALFACYSWTGRTIEYHRAQVRRALGFREAARADEEKLVFWLAAEVAPVELSDERLREALLARCRADHIGPVGCANAFMQLTGTLTQAAEQLASVLPGIADRPR
ncbi:MAG TPA: DUF4158 domain-containing protein [Actinomycetes bacterium]|nr:DUF4158 domain-containing protein [Actinomycetes bacterium]